MATENLNLAVRQYVPQYKQMLSAVFGVQRAFDAALSQLQIVDGITHSSKAFTVKTSATPVVVNNYSTDPNVAFGTGTANSTRFGNMTEVIYADTDANYSYDLAIHEGIDRHTVNNDLNQAVADRLELQSQAQTRRMNIENGKFIAENAGHTETLSDTTEDAVKELFNKLDAYYLENEVIAQVTAFVNAEVFNALTDASITTTGKSSSIDIDTNGLPRYKDFILVKTPEKYLGEGNVALFVANGVVIPFVGIETARTFESIDFDGVQLQAAAKGGTFILDDNKKAIVKVTGGGETSDPKPNPVPEENSESEPNPVPEETSDPKPNPVPEESSEPVVNEPYPDYTLPDETEGV